MANQDIVERDAAGNVTKQCRYDAKGKLIFTHVSQWENGRLIRKTAYDASGVEIGSFPYEYDERGNNTAAAWFSYKNGRLMRTESVYNDKDQVVEHTRFGAGSVATNKTFREYDDKGRLSHSEYYGAWPDCSPVHTYYFYDETGFKVKERAEDASHQLMHYTIFKPAGSGKIAEYTNYNAEGRPIYTYRFVYDAAGNKIREERYDSEGKLEQTTE